MTPNDERRKGLGLGMPTSILAYRKIIESLYEKLAVVTNQSVTNPPIGPPKPEPSCGGIEDEVKKEGCM